MKHSTLTKFWKQKRPSLWEKKRPSLWEKKQELAAPSKYYGDGGTIHGSGTIDIDIDANGHVVMVWFRCRTLPWRVSFLDERGNRSPIGYGSTNNDELPFVTGIEVYDRDR
jgi:hypothetical protein